MKKIVTFIVLTMLLGVYASISFSEPLSKAVTQPIPIAQLVDYVHYPKEVQMLITKAQKLSNMQLTYLYGSSDPKNKGMDCSGTIYYLLSETKLQNVPRDAEGMFAWVKKENKLHQVTQNNLNSSEFSDLKPGDLLFWSGTYATNHSISHVMLYLGKTNKGDSLMFGASDGRTYQGKKMWGVSVFDIKLPNGKGTQKFVGYSCIPNLTCSSPIKNRAPQ